MSTIYVMPGHLIRRLQQISQSVFTERMSEADTNLTSPQFAALSILQSNPGIDQKTLAGLIALDRSTIGGVVERLMAKGLIEREVSVTDRRARLLKLTDAGTELVERLGPTVEALQSEILQGLTKAEKTEFIRLAAKAAEAGNDLSRAPLLRQDS